MPYFFFRWIAWNLEKVEKHGLSAEVVEYVVNNSRRPYPRSIGGGRWEVIGSTPSGLAIVVIYTLDDNDTIFVIHARPLTRNERLRRRRI